MLAGFWSSAAAGGTALPCCEQLIALSAKPQLGPCVVGWTHRHNRMGRQARWGGHAKPRSPCCAPIAPTVCSCLHQLSGSCDLAAFGQQRGDGLRTGPQGSREHWQRNADGQAQSKAENVAPISTS